LSGTVRAAKNKQRTQGVAVTDYVIDYFEVPSSDSGASRAFFAKAFGWATLSYGDTYDEIREAGVLAGINGDAADRSGAPLMGIRTSDIAAAERAVLAAGGSISRQTYAFPGGKRFYFREPGGAELMVYQPAE
jgi:predicted enzyme related to lactoylglutathione lyase